MLDTTTVGNVLGNFIMKNDDIVPVSKMSKKARKKYYAAKRGSWNGLSPVTRVVRSAKLYDRNRKKQDDRSIIDDADKK